MTTQFDAHDTPAAFTEHDGFPPQMSPALVTAQPDGGACDVVPLVVVAVVVTAVVCVDVGVVAFVAAPVDTVADAVACSAVGFMVVAVARVVLTGAGCGLGVLAAVDAVALELAVVTVCAPATAGWSTSISAAPTARTVTAITAMYGHLRMSDPLPT